MNVRPPFATPAHAQRRRRSAYASPHPSSVGRSELGRAGPMTYAARAACVAWLALAVSLALGCRDSQPDSGSAATAAKPSADQASAQTPEVAKTTPAPAAADQAGTEPKTEPGTDPSAAGAPASAAEPATAGQGATAGGKPDLSDPDSLPVLTQENLIRWSSYNLGQSLSMLAIASALKDEKNMVDTSRKNVGAAAEILEVEIPKLPAEDADNYGGRILQYLTNGYYPITGKLTEKHGAAAAALFEFGMKANLVHLTYSANNIGHRDVAEALHKALSKAGGDAQLPPELYADLLALLEKKAPPIMVKNEVKTMSKRVDTHLLTAK